MMLIAASLPLKAEETAAQRLAQISPIKVQVQGTSQDLTENILLHLPSMRGLDCRSERERLNRFMDAANPKLQEAAESMGYYDARFNMTLVRQAKCWVFNIKAATGSQVRVNKQNIKVQGEGAKLDAFQKIQEKPPYQLGDPLIHQPYEDFKSKLNRASNRLGFFEADYQTKRLEVDPDKLEANVIIDYQTGKRYRIGEVNVQQDILDQKYLQRYMKVKPGEFYDSEELLQQQRLLEASGYYKDVRLRTKRREAKNQQVPVEIEAIRREQYTYTGKLGYGTDTGARVEAKMEAHWVNPKGHKLTVESNLSKPESNAGFNYKVPLWEPEHEFAALTAGWERSDNNDIKSNAWQSEFSYNRRNDSDWQQTAYVKYLQEKTETSAKADRSELTLLGARVKKIETDGLLFPKEGWQASLELQGAHDTVLSDQTLFQAKAQGKYLQSFDQGGKLIVRGDVGGTVSDELKDIPKSLRFFAGGQNSVRGFDFESLGTKDSNGDVVGGKNVFTSSIEYEHPLNEKWGAAGFVDAGNAFDDWGDYEVKVGAGFGARYKSPIGPVKFDLATPTDKTDLHVYFSLGPEF